MELERFEYFKTPDGYAITGILDKTVTDIVIPEGVCAIAGSAFRNHSHLKSISFPKSLTGIYTEAFWGCSSLKKISFPSALKDLGKQAFKDCSSLESISFPSTLTKIGEEAFCGCVSLASIAFPDTLTEIGKRAFEGCQALESVTLPKNIALIEKAAFGGCRSLKSVTIPHSQVKIEELAFSCCGNLKSVTIPSTAKHIPENAFDLGCSIERTQGEGTSKKQTVSANKALEPTKSSTDQIVQIPTSEKLAQVFDFVETPDGYCITGILDGTVTEIVIPEGVCTISEGAFRFNRHLKSVLLPNTLTYISSNAFYGCSALKSIFFPSGLKKIGEEAFGNCLSLELISFPGTLEEIGRGAFQNCWDLESVILPQNLMSIQKYTFEHCHTLKSVTLPYCLTSIEDWAFAFCDLKLVAVPNTVKRISANAFDDRCRIAKIQVEAPSSPKEAVSAPVVKARMSVKFSPEQIACLRNAEDMVQISNFIEKLKQDCNNVLMSETTVSDRIQKEQKQVDDEAKKLIKDMQLSLSQYEKKHFEMIKDKIQSLLDILASDYSYEYKKTPSNPGEFEGMSYADAQKALDEIFVNINEYIAKLNDVDFDALVPSIKTVVEDESFYICNKDGRKIGSYDCNSSIAKTKTNAPKPIKEIVEPLFVQCKRAQNCVDYVISTFRQAVAISEYEAYVQSSAKTWMAERTSKIQGEHQVVLDDAFLSDKAQSRYSQFFRQLEEHGREFDVDVKAGTLTYKEAITIGDLSLPVEDNPQYLSIIESVPALEKNIVKGRLTAPIIIDLKKCGNILLEVNSDDEYSATVKHFVEQLIIQFLLSFPPNRINFRLVDISNKIGFSPFSILTKINTDILYEGIVRDDRKLEDIIKDMETLMYSVEDKKLSINNVNDIFAYNAAFEANPQNVNLFVLVDYPNGMREDLAQHVLKIIQNGNTAGIFTIIVSNNAIKGSYNYKKEDIDKFVAAVKKKALCIHETRDGLTIEGMGEDSVFMPKKNISTSQLSGIVEMMQMNAETSKQKVVSLAQLFEETDRVVASPRGITSSAEVLDIPIGVKGGEIQTLQLKTTGDGSAHAVVIGGTGSGKSNLLHTIIMNVCYKYSPDEVNLYLVDFKGGVEFKYYEANRVCAKQIPHIKLTGLTSDLEDGVAILSNLQKELREREDAFRVARVEDIMQYRQLGNKMPRLFVIVDEIQELFEQDEKLGQKAIDILRELFKKGRAFGINILWASQNVPHAVGLKDKVLSQIGNRISLRLNEPDDAIDIKIDPKVVRNLNRPEKGLGVINDMRYGNDSVEFRVAYAENSNNRDEYSQKVIDKWASVTAANDQEPLFIVGDDEDPKANVGTTVYSTKPMRASIVSKAFETYTVQIGQDYITGKPFNLNLPIRENKSNIMFMGLDVEILRDLMGYSLLSVIIEHSTNADCIVNPAKLYYSNGEMVNPKNSADLFNVARDDFAELIENVSSTEKFKDTIAKLYMLYQERVAESENATSAIPYAPNFVIVHSLQRYTDLFNSNPMLSLAEDESAPSMMFSVGDMTLSGDFGAIVSAAYSGQSSGTYEIPGGGASGIFKNMSPTPPKKTRAFAKEAVSFVDAFKELLNQAGQFGIHFIISLDNPEGIRCIKEEIAQTKFRVFTKGVNANVVSQMIGVWGSGSNVNNSKVALVSVQDERYKVRIYRYEEATDAVWYNELVKNYRALRG